MKRSKLFLGITSALLAVVGIAAAKSHSVNSGNPFYFTNENASTGCSQDVAQQLTYKTFQDGNAQLQSVVPGIGLRKLYVTSACQIKATAE